MQQQPEITFRFLNESPAVRQLIESHVGRLERFFPRILSCRVLVEAPPGRHRKGTPYHVRVDVAVPGGDIVANPRGGAPGDRDDLYCAISDSFSAVARQLRDHSNRRRCETQRHQSALVAGLEH